MRLLLYIFVNVLIVGLFLYSKLTPHKDRLTGNFLKTFNFFDKIFHPILGIFRPMARPAQVGNGIASIIKDLRTDPYALETVWVSIIAFAGKSQKITPLIELYSFYPPRLPIGGGTSLGNALEFLMNDIDTSLQKTTLEQKGDWKPIIFLFTDGNPTDNVDSAFDSWNQKYRTRTNLVAVSYTHLTLPTIYSV